ncbi:cytochrome c biogenesis protein ResB [Brachybacterium sp. DNPG3]
MARKKNADGATTADGAVPDGPTTDGPASDGPTSGGPSASDPASEGWSSKTDKDGVVVPPSLGLRGTLLFLWRQLTSMQTALILLMLLAVAAVPGSLYPQRSVNSTLTAEFLEENGTYGEVLDKLGMFDVFSSPWFSAIYLLLFISLIGCIVPRVMVHLRQLRAKPPRTPSRLSRFVGHTRVELPGVDADELLATAQRTLRRRRYRTDRIVEKRSGSVSAERGLLRETGNLVFHIALLGVLVCVAGGQLTSYRGQVTIIEGGGFSNSLTQYDSFDSGVLFDSAELAELQFTLDDFRATYDTSQTDRIGTPLSFEADVTVTTPDRDAFTQTLQVNKPLNVDGTSVFLLGNGYAPEITLTDPEGTVVAEGPLITIPSGDTGYTSQLVLKAPDAEPEQTAVVGYFLPTGVIDESGPHSTYPDLLDPQIAVTVYQGDLGLDDGIPQNAYSIDLSTLTPLTADDSDSPLLIRLSPGEEYELPDGSVLSFDGVRRYAAFDVAHDPFERWVLGFALAAALGLILSLFVPRRRLWVRAAPTADGSGTILEVAGLARSEDPSLEDDVAALVRRLAGDEVAPAGPTAPTDAQVSTAQETSTTSLDADPSVQGDNGPAAPASDDASAGTPASPTDRADDTPEGSNR